MIDSLSFDAMADIYDETRDFDEESFGLALDFISDRYPPQEYTRLFEPGIGSGRIACPLAQRGYHITGLDLSMSMLGLLKQRLCLTNCRPNLVFQRGDVTRLPYADDAFEIAVVVHLFYFIREWKHAIREILRVVRDGHPTILMHTGMGKEVPFLNDRYKALCAARGFSTPTLGAKSTQDVVDYLHQLGCRTQVVSDRWQWVSEIVLEEALESLRERAYSFTIFTPKGVHEQVMSELEQELEAEFGGPRASTRVPNQIYLVVVGDKAFSI